jgi:oxygen-independent coproporphyrinogen-3 oxidase
MELEGRMGAFRRSRPRPVRIHGDPEPREKIGSVYVHAPFCAHRCFYCDFAVSVARAGDLAGWTAALNYDLEGAQAQEDFELKPVLDTLFVGGGTPSIFGPRAMEELSRVVGASRLSNPELEWTAEANPESFTPEVAKAWEAAGMNRLSLGVQSFQPEVLTWLRRLHGPEKAWQAVEIAREAGIENVSLDLMFGLPGSVERSWTGDLEAVLGLGVPHVSLYGLTIETGTPLHQGVAEGSVPTPDETEYGRQYLEACAILRGAGYLQYEVSNFALPGADCRHNQVYWNREPYLGLGNSAHSFRHPHRRWNLRDWSAYQRACAAGESPVQEEEWVDERQARLERIWLGLRTWRGLWLPDLSASARELAGQWVETGRAGITEDRLCLTPKGWLLLDHLVVELDTAQG